MATSEISVAVTGEMANLICAAVESGEYGTHADVVRAALESWQVGRDQQLAYLRSAWKQALPSDSVTVDLDEMFEQLHARHGVKAALVDRS